MANICDFSMVVRGKRENIEQFIDMMQHKGTIWMGRGYEDGSIDTTYEK